MASAKDKVCRDLEKMSEEAQQLLFFISMSEKAMYNEDTKRIFLKMNERLKRIWTAISTIPQQPQN
jgi:hypothetical protein